MVSIQNKIQLENLVTGTSVYFEWVALLGNTSDVKKPFGGDEPGDNIKLVDMDRIIWCGETMAMQLYASNMIISKMFSGCLICIQEHQELFYSPGTPTTKCIPYTIQH